MKAITPVIALVMLLLITVGIVGVSYAWIGGLITASTAKMISIPPGGAYCDNGGIRVYVVNNGDGTITSSDIIVADVDSVNVLNTPFFGGMGSGLVGYWNFDGDANDNSGYGNDGTVDGATQTDGQFGNAYDFDGDNDVITVSNHPSLNFGASTDFSLSFWVNADALNGADNEGFFYKASGWWDKGYAATIEDYSTHYSVYFRAKDGTNAVVAGTGNMNTGTWYYVVGTFDRDGLAKSYLNGAFVNSGDMTSVGDIDVSNNLYIGENSDLDIHFDGKLDEMIIYNRILTETEITEYYEQTSVNIQPGQAGLVISYPRIEGKHIIRVGTSSGIAETSVACY